MIPQFVAVAADEEDLLLTMMQEFYLGEALPFDRDAARRAVRELRGDPSLGRVYLVVAGGEAVGYVVLAFGFSLEYRGRDAFLDELYIRENARGVGLGTAAIQWAESVCRAEEIRALHLEVDRRNQRGQHLYRGLGFAGHDRYLMTKWID